MAEEKQSAETNAPHKEPAPAVTTPSEPAPILNPDDKIAKALDAGAVLKHENDRFEKLLERHEALAVEKVLGGQASAGKPEEKEESDEDYAAKVMSNEV